MDNAKATDTDLRLGFIDYPSKSKETVSNNWADDMVKVLLSKDAEKTWRDMIAEYRKNGYDQIINEFNAKTNELGIK